MTIFTLPITQPLTITAAMGIQRMSFKARGGTVFMRGTATLVINGSAVASQNIPFADGQGDLLAAYPQAPIDGVILDPNGNAIDIQVFNC